MNFKEFVLVLQSRGVTEEVVHKAFELNRIDELIAVLQRPALLEHVKTVNMPAVAEDFVAREKLIQENGFWLFPKAKELLLEIVEKAIPAGKVAIDQLTQDAVRGSIKEELGPRAEIPLVRFWAVLKLGHEAVGDVVIAYIKDLPGWTVYAHSRGGGEWYVGVCLVTDPYEWSAGCHVLSQSLIFVILTV